MTCQLPFPELPVDKLVRIHSNHIPHNVLQPGCRDSTCRYWSCRWFLLKLFVTLTRSKEVYGLNNRVFKISLHYLLFSYSANHARMPYKPPLRFARALMSHESNSPSVTTLHKDSCQCLFSSYYLLSIYFKNNTIFVNQFIFTDY